MPPIQNETIVNDIQLDISSRTIVVKYNYLEWVATDFRVIVYGHNGLEQLFGRKEDNAVNGMTEVKDFPYNTTVDKGLLVPIDKAENNCTIRLENLDPFKDYWMKIFVRSKIGFGKSTCWGPFINNGKLK